MRPSLLFLLAFITFLACNAQDCGSIFNNTHSSYETLKREIRSVSWEVEDSFQSPESSVIKYAEYYQHGQHSALIARFQSGSKEYVWIDVPQKIWQGWKEAGSKGTYYHKNIKGKYNASHLIK